MIKEFPKTTLLYLMLVMTASYYIGTLDVHPYVAGVISGVVAVIVGIPFIFYWIKKSDVEKR